MTCPYIALVNKHSYNALWIRPNQTKERKSQKDEFPSDLKMIYAKNTLYQVNISD